MMRQLAIGENGLVSDEFRRRVWPVLSRSLITASPENENEEDPDFQESEEELLSRHPEYRQVEMDVRRTLARFPPHIDDEARMRLQHLLIPLVVRILLYNPTFRYYQGFHDVCLTVLLVVEDPVIAYRICRRLACANFRQFLEKPLEIATESLYLMYPLFKRVDPELYEFMWRSQVGVMFALSWQLTWFAHVIDDYSSVVRLYDLFLASHPLMPIYFAASLILYRSPDILALECDMAYVHGFLSKPPANLPLEALISDAQDLFVEYPPSMLKELNVALKKEQARLMKLSQLRKRHSSWPVLLGIGNRDESPSKKAVKITVLTVAAATAAWFFYSRYPLGVFRVV